MSKFERKRIQRKSSLNCKHLHIKINVFKYVLVCRCVCMYEYICNMLSSEDLMQVARMCTPCKMRDVERSEMSGV